jgi:threonine/homoserine/homoserine lactone efflux protein
MPILKNWQPGKKNQFEQSIQPMQMVSAFLLGMILSFLGQLPLGTLSLTATQICIQENFRNAWKYSLGVAVVEMIYLRLILSGMQWILLFPSLFHIFNGITAVLFLILGIGSLMAAQKQKNDKKALILNYPMDRFLLGAGLSALNPAQIPFWFIWSAYFLNAGWLKPGLISFHFFTIGSGLGTLGGLAAYMYGGYWLVTKLKTGSRTLNTVTGIVFIIAAGVQLYRL